MIYTKRRTLLSKAIVTYSGYVFVGLVIGQLALWQQHAVSKLLFVIGVALVTLFLILAFFMEPKED